MTKTIYIIRIEGDGIKKNLMGGCGEALQERFNRVVKTLAEGEDKIVKDMGAEGTVIYTRGKSDTVWVTLEPLMEI